MIPPRPGRARAPPTGSWRRRAGSWRPSSAPGARLLVGLLLGLGFFFLQRFIESGTIVFNLDPVILAWLPTAILVIVTLGLLARVR